jgi:hypothetical protein
MMYFPPVNRLMAAVVLCVLCLQGCGSTFQVASEGEQVTNEDLVLAVPSSDVSNSRLSTATSATLVSVAMSTVQVVSPTRHVAVRPDAVSILERSSSMDSGEIDAHPSARPTTRVSGPLSVDCFSASLGTLSLHLPTIFDSQEWRRYFGELGEGPPLPPDIDEILDSPCPFWPGKRVKDTHLLVLIPATVDGKAFTLDLLGELIQSPRGDSPRTQYFLYDDEVQRSSGDVYSISSYWVLLTRDVLPGSRNKPYEAQQALVATRSSHVDDPPYEIPNVLEAATAILSYYVRSGDRLYEGGSDALPSTSTRCTTLLEDASGHPSLVTVGRFCSRGLVFLSGFDDDAEFGVSCLRRFGSRHYRPSALLHSFGAEDWRQYLGVVEEAPPLPVHIVDTLNSACPFWLGKQVKDTHLLVLIPAIVNGEPFSLNLLGALIQRPQGGGYSIEYSYYGSAVRKQFGAQSPVRSYWVLMTRDVLEGSRRKDYASQQNLVAAHAKRTGLPYELPGALEAATAVLSHYVRSGERLYADAPWTYTRCQDLVVWYGGYYPADVGGFSSGGLHVDHGDNVDVGHCYGVAGLCKF